MCEEIGATAVMSDYLLYYFIYEEMVANRHRRRTGWLGRLF
jgi:hypothetical protein